MGFHLELPLCFFSSFVLVYVISFISSNLLFLLNIGYHYWFKPILKTLELKPLYCPFLVCDFVIVCVYFHYYFLNVLISFGKIKNVYIVHTVYTIQYLSHSCLTLTIYNQVLCTYLHSNLPVETKLIKLMEINNICPHCTNHLGLLRQCNNGRMNGLPLSSLKGVLWRQCKQLIQQSCPSADFICLRVIWH